MKPIKFKGSNAVIAEDQKEYLPLPAYVERKHGIVTSCWSLSFWERLRILFTGRFFFSVWTFGHPLQPQMPSTQIPEWIPRPRRTWRDIWQQTKNEWATREWQ